MDEDVSKVTRIASLIATSPPEMRNDSFRGICRWVSTTLSIGLVAVIMLASLPAILRNPACLMVPSAFWQSCAQRGTTVSVTSSVSASGPPEARASQARRNPHHITQPQGFQQVGTRRRLPRSAQVDRLPVVFELIAEPFVALRMMPCRPPAPTRLGTAMAWPFPARGAGPAARIHPVMFGSHTRKSRHLAQFRGETVEQFSSKIRPPGGRSL